MTGGVPTPRQVSVLTGLRDLVLPGGCAGCGAVTDRQRYGVCPDCVAAVRRLRPAPTRPVPPPPGLPPCAALGGYGGVLRELVIGYKDRGRHRLARPLGRLLAAVVTSLLAPSSGPGAPVLLVPVPDTPAAARARHGDHLWRLARWCAAALRQQGRPVLLTRPLRARPRPDSTTLSSDERLRAARAALRVRPLRVTGVRYRLAARPMPVILLDDVVTTGATLAAAADRLAAAGVPVTGAAVLAATRRTGG